MATNLKDIELHEISLVDEPANKGAKVLLFKRNDSHGASEEKRKGTGMQNTNALVALVKSLFAGRVAIGKGSRLARALNNRIDEMTGDNTPRADIVGRMASAAGISESTTSSILVGDIIRPPDGRLRGFARVLGLSFETLQRLADQDDETEDEPNFPSNTRKKRKEKSMKTDELTKALDDLDVSDEVRELVESLNKAGEEAITAAEAHILDIETELEKAKRKRPKNPCHPNKKEAADGDDKDELNKAELPEVVQKALDDKDEEIAKANTEAAEATKRVEKLEDKQLTDEITKRVEACEHIPADEREDLVKTLKALDPDSREAMFKRFEADGKVVTASSEQLFKGVGQDGGGQAGDSFQKIESLAKEKLEKGEFPTIEQARVAVRKANPDLAQAERDENKARAN